MHFRQTRHLVGASGTLGRIAAQFLDIVLPPRCLSCGTIVAEAGGLCPACWSGLTFISSPYCTFCGTSLPFVDVLAGNEILFCAQCAARRPEYGRARAALIYDSASRPMILALKHADCLQAVDPFARWMMRAANELIADAEVIVPVPLHRWRLFTRRYNQAALLAQALGRMAGRMVAVDALHRQRATESQGHKSRGDRRRNVAGAFMVSAAGQRAVSGRRVLLVDDVMTTGATVGACADTLYKAGAAVVDVVTLARVVQGRQR